MPKSKLPVDGRTRPETIRNGQPVPAPFGREAQIPAPCAAASLKFAKADACLSTAPLQKLSPPKQPVSKIGEGHILFSCLSNRPFDECPTAEHSFIIAFRCCLLSPTSLRLPSPASNKVRPVSHHNPVDDEPKVGIDGVLLRRTEKGEGIIPILPLVRNGSENYDMPAPRVGGQFLQDGDKSGAKGIEMDVANQLEKVGFFLAYDRFVPVLKEMALGVAVDEVSEILRLMNPQVVYLLQSVEIEMGDVVAGVKGLKDLLASPKEGGTVICLEVRRRSLVPGDLGQGRCHQFGTLINQRRKQRLNGGKSLGQTIIEVSLQESVADDNEKERKEDQRYTQGDENLSPVPLCAGF